MNIKIFISKKGGMIGDDEWKKVVGESGVISFRFIHKGIFPWYGKYFIDLWIDDTRRIIPIFEF